MLKVENLYSGYKDIEVLHGISLEVNKGEIVSLVGLNGAGKTTLLKTISGVIPVLNGKVEFRNKDVTKFSVEEFVEAGLVYIPENRLLFSALTVEENLILGTVSKGTDFRKKRLTERLEFVYNFFPILKERHKQRAGTLSGGEQQMLAIGRGLMSDPEIILLDEPSLGLAPLVVDRIFEVLKKLNKQGVAIFLVEQNVALSLELSDRAYVLDLGKIIMEGKGKDLLNDGSDSKRIPRWILCCLKGG